MPNQHDPSRAPAGISAGARAVEREFEELASAPSRARLPRGERHIGRSAKRACPTFRANAPFPTDSL
jgi:hypothetical protein